MLQHLRHVGGGVYPGTGGGEGGVVDLQKHAALPGGPHQRRIVQGIAAVVWVSQDTDLGAVVHGADHGRCILLRSAALGHAPDMLAGDGHVQIVQQLGGEIHSAVKVHHVELRAHHDPYAVDLPVDDPEVEKVVLVGG